jgi:hypothetical protein
MTDDDILAGAQQAVDEALAEIPQRPPAPGPEPERAVPLPPIDIHIAEIAAAMVLHNQAIATAQSAYADAVNASRAKLEAAQNELRAAERDLAARWHGGVG